MSQIVYVPGISGGSPLATDENVLAGGSPISQPQDIVSGGDPMTLLIYWQSVDDGVAFSDTPSRTVRLSVTADDVARLTGISSKMLSILRSVSDSADIAGDLLPSAAFSIQLLDGVTILDSASTVAALVAVTADFLGVSDTTAAALILGVLASDGITNSDTLAAVADLLTWVVDAASIDGSPRRTLGTTAVISDLARLAEIAAKSSRLPVEAVDSLAVNDSKEAFMAFLAGISDTVGLTSAASSVLVALLLVTDAIEANDTTSRFATFRPAVTDGVGLTGDDLPTGKYIAQALGTMNLSASVDVLARTVYYVVDGIRTAGQTISAAKLVGAIADALKILESPLGIAALQAQAHDAAELDDGSWPRVLELILAESVDGVSVADIGSARGAYLAKLTDGMQFSEVLGAILAGVARATDGALLTESALGQVFGQILEGLASDGILFSGDLVPLLRRLVLLADNIITTDAGVVEARYFAECMDGAGFVSALASVLRLAALVSDGAALSDEVIQVDRLPAGEVSVSFRVKGATLTFVMSSPGAGFEVRVPAQEADVKIPGPDVGVRVPGVTID